MMPLLFKSLSHGDIPFGFFNIETDMILLDNCFFFANDTAKAIVDLASLKDDEVYRAEWEVRRIDLTHIGNLLGAIAGVDLHGFIGEVYSHFPFPHIPEEFKQNPEGYRTRGLIEGIAQKYAVPSTIEVVTDPKKETVNIGEYVFGREGFGELLDYLWVGGYPRWKDGIRPPYIEKMREGIEASTSSLLRGVSLLR
jgi:hypothetical protein